MLSSLRQAPLCALPDRKFGEAMLKEQDTAAGVHVNCEWSGTNINKLFIAECLMNFFFLSGWTNETNLWACNTISALS